MCKRNLTSFIKQADNAQLSYARTAFMLLPTLLTACTNTAEHNQQQINQLTQRIELLETANKEEKETLSKLKQKEADLDLLLTALSQQADLPGYQLDTKQSSTITVTPITTQNKQIDTVQPELKPDNLVALDNLTGLDNLSKTNSQTNHQPASQPKYAVQIASLSSKYQYQQAWREFKIKFPQISQQSTPLVEDITKDNIPFYRLKIGPYSKNEANNICQQLKQNKQSCLTTNYTGSKF
ncbi:SPOR domain-containing protein [Catenovulum sp. 2E275]|uniref:SPOR domain-containing protein n=1 Tax=Catenovulum sp. 2E275 TaxID=2980497 RepID=UPI0021D18E84|nr:SPOR domain-containing protein [Catenovulum sp. 2E275]MCU4677442.1 SPOR domain-containing protein [Catenovulum sp. 2E275]